MVAPDEEAIVRCETSTGTITMKMMREWAPIGYDRAVELFERKFFDGSHFFRAVPKFLVQFGISYSKDQELQKFARQTIPDDPPKGIRFQRGTISFAGSGDNSRSSQMFISYGASSSLGKAKWETPIGEVIEGMEHAEEFYSYGDMPPWGEGPVQQKIHGHPEYIEENFPKTAKFVHCKVERLNIEEEGGITYKADKKTDEEEFARDRELMQVNGGGVKVNGGQEPYRPHIKDQMGLPSQMDAFSTYGGLVVLSTMAVAMLLLSSRKKVTGKSN